MVVNYSKQSKMEKAAKTYIAKTGTTDRAFRFDVATVVVESQKEPQISYLETAFLPKDY